MRVQMQSGVKSGARPCDGLRYIESALILASLGAVSNLIVYRVFSASRENLNGACCFTFEEPGVGSDAEAF